MYSNLIPIVNKKEGVIEMETTESKVIALITKYCETPQTLTTEMMLDELNIASINIMEIIISVEEEFDVTVKDEDLQSLTTIQSIIDYIEAKIA